MNNENPQGPAPLKESMDTAKGKIGKELLTDEDILALTAESIAHTYTFEEKGYSQDSP